MAASGLLIVRAILVWGDGGDDYQFGIEMPVAFAVVLACALIVVALLFPPSEALARTTRPLSGKRSVVGGLGTEWRVWFLVAAPVCGLLVIFVPFVIPTALGWNDEIPADLWLGLPLGIIITVGSVAGIWTVARSLLHGVELTPSHLVARGYFRSRRFKRHEVVDVRIVDISWWANLLFLLARMGVSSTVRITLADGSRHVLNAANSRWEDMEYGVEVIRNWAGTTKPAG